MNEILLVDKPAGWTSFDVVAKIRGIVSKKEGRKLKVGHAGTLDPFATGLLIVLLGDATKEQDKFMKLDKEYEATLKLGFTSTTGDPEGEQKAISDKRPAISKIKDILKKFTGKIEQIPPAYSAIKVNGQRAYALARKGEKVELKPRQITVYDIKIENYNWPELHIKVKCSSGTYIRTLAEDIGQALKTGAYLTSLRRTKIGTYNVAKALRKREIFWKIQNSNLESRIKSTENTAEVKIPILMYHRISSQINWDDPHEPHLTVSPETFEKQIKYLNKMNSNFLNPEEIAQIISGQIPFPKNPVMVTFDDGYENVFQNVFPVIKKYKVKATAFIITDTIDSHEFGHAYLNSKEIKEMANQGFSFGSHAKTHSKLDELDNKEVMKELKESKEKLEKIIGKSIISICYPFGNYNCDVIEKARQLGYLIGFSTVAGKIQEKNRPFELKRIYVGEHFGEKEFQQIMSFEKPIFEEDLKGYFKHE